MSETCQSSPQHVCLRNSIHGIDQEAKAHPAGGALAPALLNAPAGPKAEDAIASQSSRFLRRGHGDLMEGFTTTARGDEWKSVHLAIRGEYPM